MDILNYIVTMVYKTSYSQVGEHDSQIAMVKSGYYNELVHWVYPQNLLRLHSIYGVRKSCVFVCMGN